MHRTRSGLWVVLLLVPMFAPGVMPRADAAEHSVPLVEAVERGDVAQVRSLLLKKADVNAAQADGTTALHWAAHLNNVAVVDMLLKAGASMNATNRYGATPFSLAAASGHAKVIERLLVAGENPNLVVGGEHVLMMAARSGHVDAIKSLLAAGSTINYQEPDRRQTALMWAAAEGNAGAITALLEAGADMTLRSKAPKPAPTRGSIPRVNDPLGLRAYRDPSYAINTDGLEFTALLFAVRGGHLAATKALLDGGADANEAKTDDGTTALILAVANCHWEVAGLLLDRGADPNRGPGFTALHQLAWARRYHQFSPVGHKFRPEQTGTVSSIDLAKKILARGVDINAQMKRSFRDGYRNRMNRIGATAFLLSSKLVDVPMIRLLAANGADMHIQNEDLDTPLMLAAGVAVHNPGEDAGTEAEVLDAVKVLVELGFDVNTTNRNNETAMHGAAYLGFPSLVTWLYERGARFDVKNIIGWAPLTIADGVFYSGFYKAQPTLAARIRELYEKEGMAVPPVPKVNDTSLLTLNNDQQAGEKRLPDPVVDPTQIPKTTPGTNRTETGKTGK